MIDDSDFSNRFAALFVPMTFKFIGVMMPLMASAALIAAFPGFGNKQTKETLLIYFAYTSGPISTYLFYIFLNRSFERLGALINVPNKRLDLDGE